MHSKLMSDALHYPRCRLPAPLLVTNILVVGKSEQTHSRLQQQALDLFAEYGFEATTVERIARAAGVSEMTFFRHFPTKDAVVLDDPFDPQIAAAVAAQPGSLGASCPGVPGPAPGHR